MRRASYTTFRGWSLLTPFLEEIEKPGLICIFMFQLKKTLHELEECRTNLNCCLEKNEKLSRLVTLFKRASTDFLDV